MPDRICQHCSQPMNGRRGQTCGSCYYKTRPRIPCHDCNQPTGYFLNNPQAPEHPRCQACQDSTRKHPKRVRIKGGRNLTCQHCNQQWNYKDKGQAPNWCLTCSQGIPITCDYCQATKTISPRHAQAGQRYCDLTCANRHKISNNPHDYQAKRQVELYTGPRSEPTKTTQGKGLWTSGQCRVCQAWFISNNLDVTCSPQCWETKRRADRRNHKDRRRALKRNAYRADVNRKKVFMADGYRCHLCNKKTDPTKTAPHPKAPTIDHILPLAKGGTHEPANCRTACFICNARKTDKGGGEQYAIPL